MQENEKFEVRYYGRRRPEVIRLIPDKAQRILDVGCGNGELGKVLKQKKGVVVHGIEVCEAAGRRASAHLDRVWIGRVEDMLDELHPCTYDCIVVADVLEHLADPYSVLKNLVHKLQPAGTVVASLPNVQYEEIVLGLCAGRWNYTSEGLLDRTHLRFFTRQSVRELFWAAGLHVTHMEENRDSYIKPVGRKFPGRRRAFFFKAFQDRCVWQFLVRATKSASIPTSPGMGVILRLTPGPANAPAPPTPAKHIIFQKKFPCLTVEDWPPSLDQIMKFCSRDHRIELVMVLDAQVVPNDSLVDSMAFFAQCDPSIGILFPGTYSDPECTRLSSIGFRWSFSRHQMEALGRGDSASHWPFPVCLDSGTPHAFAVKREVFKDVGGFDERLNLKWQMHDFCYRALRRGYLSVYVPEARVWHPSCAPEQNTASNGMFFDDVLGQLLWAERYCAFGEWYTIFRKLLHSALTGTVPKMNFRPPYTGSPLRGLYWQACTWARTFRKNLADPGKKALWHALKVYVLRAKLRTSSSGVHLGRA
ncbi:MAG: methyltransferase domain-containing protein [Desulfosoma sp.]|uniref:methyltransferase domain-containing protein n=1 Tax=Desulfosoma sp. TaxID=2603217 RepID=UPI00404BA332